MDVIYLGLMFCEASLQDEFATMKRKVAMAPHKFQANVINGIEAQAGVKLSVLHVPPTGSFPINSKKLFSKSYAWGEDNLQIGYLNLPWIKHKIQQRKLYKQVKQRIKDPKDTCLMLYSLYEPYLKIAWKIKQEYPDIQICLIHTDAVPGRDDMEKYMTKEAIARGNRAVSLAKCVDRFILLSENLTEPLEVGQRPYLVLECICDDTQPAAQTENIIPGTFLYTGEISKAFGMCELTEAFRNMPALQLWICGDGDARESIVALSSQYPNIRYFGFVPPKKVKELQDQCAFLVNPRRPAGTYTKYSFPSKTAEYMMTGKPVVMYKLEAIPDDYDQYIHYLTAAEPEGIAAQLQEIANQDYGALLHRAAQGREYMRGNKSKRVAGQKIVAFLQVK